ncbi:MAG: sugar-transfer associated ATP-grasp domain-containing protein [Bacteroidota bacterium]
MGQILREMAHWRRTRPSPLREYVALALYRQSAGDPRHYLGNDEWRTLVRSWRTDEAARAFRDKGAFHRTVSEIEGVRQPRRLGGIEAGAYLHPDGRTTALEASTDLAGVLRKVVAENETPLFLKPAEGREGKGAFRLGAGDLADGVLPEAVWEGVRGDAYMVEAVVRQHAALDALYPESLNTARFVTCRSDGAPPQIVGVFLRVGSGGRPVDNVGGLFAPLDLASGRLVGPLRQTVADGGEAFDRHPDTGVAVQDLVVPDVSEAVETVRRVASAFAYPVVGWDIGFSEAGPVLIEGNDWPGTTKLQAATGGLLANPAFAAFLRRRSIWPEVQAWSGGEGHRAAPPLASLSSAA